MGYQGQQPLFTTEYKGHKIEGYDTFVVARQGIFPTRTETVASAIKIIDGWIYDTKHGIIRNTNGEDVTADIRAYKAARAVSGYSEEEIFEMRAAFGEGENVVDIFTGKTITL